MRKIETVCDAKIIDPNGEVIIFYKNGGNFVIQQCQDDTVLKTASGRDWRYPDVCHRMHNFDKILRQSTPSSMTTFS